MSAEDPGAASLLLLGVVQGLTEFLPVSSSGHLVLGREWMGLPRAGLAREVALHLGTLLSVIVFCFKDLLGMLSAGSAGLWRLMLGSTLVTGVLGLLLEAQIETSLNNVASAGAGLIVTSLLLIVVAPQHGEDGRPLSSGSWRDALILGLFQSLALMPGISRAGATIVGALVLGFARPDAVRVAFLISIPVVAGAVLLKVSQGEALAEMTRPEMGPAILVAGLVGLLALRIVRVNSGPRALRRFGAYTLVLGIVAIASA
ncbi:MAG: undecaprenyl-diphosphatase [Planctomycetota bacterium]|nr:MAG: undecaprenyl-diphosphatase [Planctomycetota bacterium]